MNLFINITCTLTFLIFFIPKFNAAGMSSPPIYSTDPAFEIDSHQIISPQAYSQRATSLSTYTSTHSAFSVNSTQIVFGITAFDFLQSAASFSFNIAVVARTSTNYQFSFTILNQTVFYQLKIDSVIINNSLTQVYLHQINYTCSIINQGVGQRSENISIPLSTITNVNYFHNLPIYGVMYLHGINAFNPNGSYLYFWTSYDINFTHITYQLFTTDLNIITFVNVVICALDSYYQQNTMSFQRFIVMTYSVCEYGVAISCVGKNEWYPPSFILTSNSYLFGFSGFKLSKFSQTKLFLNTNPNSFNIGYIETIGMNIYRFSVVYVALLSCSSGYFDPTDSTCKASCILPATPYMYNSLCRGCHYSCTSGQCSGYASSGCTQCSGTSYRTPGSGSAPFTCICMPGYLDMGGSACQPCSLFMKGCSICSSTTVCTTCMTGLHLVGSKCVCINSNDVLTLNQSCIALDGCLEYFSYGNGTLACMSCNSSQNFTLSAYHCVCKNGYVSSTLNGTSTKVCIIGVQVCGNGLRTFSEQCDDGNLVNEDGCDASCQIQPGYLCFGQLFYLSFCLESRTKISYLGAMKIQDQTVAELYFQFQPYNILLDNASYLLQFLSTSITSNTTVMDPTYQTEADLPNDAMHIILQFSYSEPVSQTINQSMTFKISDSTHSIRTSTNFFIKGQNLQLLMYEGYQNFFTFNYVIYALIILAFLCAFASLFSQNWIGIELIHCFQYCYFYFILYDNIDEKQIKFLSTIEYVNGLNLLIDDQSLIQYQTFNRKLYLMNYRKEMLMNFSYTSLLYAIPLLLLLAKLCKLIYQRCCIGKNTKISQTNAELSQKNNVHSLSRLQYILSSEFIIGKVFISITLMFMNQIIFSFFIEQTPSSVNNSPAAGIIFEQIYTFMLVFTVLSTVGLLIATVLSPFKYENDGNQKQQLKQVIEFVKFKRFTPTYPLAYTIFNLVKMMLLGLFFENTESLYIIWSMDFIYLIGITIWRPYKKLREFETQYCYLLHNLHIIWNSLCNCLLVGVILIETKNVISDLYTQNIMIRFVIMAIFSTSTLFGYLRLFGSKKLVGLLRINNVKQQMTEKIQYKQQAQVTERPLKKAANSHQKKHHKSQQKKIME